MNLWVKTAYIGMLLGLFILFKAYIAFRRPEKVLSKTDELDIESMVEYISSYIKNSAHLAIIGIILTSVSAIILVIL